MDYRANKGWALCHYRDSDWGEQVHIEKYQQQSETGFSEELLEACFELYTLREYDVGISWVTCIPSVIRPGLVKNLSIRLAKGLGLPFKDVLSKAQVPSFQQEGIITSAHQYESALQSLEIIQPPDSGAVLLVDDIVRSGWTLAVAATLLRSKGSGEVYPLALAKVRG